MKVSFNRLRRSTLVAIALAFAAVGLIPAFMSSASAYGQVTARSVQMSSSVAGATGVSYLTTFTPAAATQIRAIAVDFCANDPIIGDSCTAPTTLSTAAAGVSGVTTPGETGTFVAGTANTGRTFTLVDDAATGTPTASTPWSFTITGMVNPNFGSCSGTVPNCTFYARIFTFSSAANLTTWLATADGSASATAIDAGGIALSTNAQILLTAKVQETLTFCIYTGANCAAGGASVFLGDTNNVLSSSSQFVDVTTKYDLASNAASGVIVRMKGGLPTSGANDINTIGLAAVAPTDTQEEFGLCTYKPGSGAGPGALVGIAPYDSGASPTDCESTSQTAGTGGTGGVGTATFAFHTANAASTYGDELATMPAADVTNGVIAFVGGAAVTTPAGIYTTNLNFIATGVY